MHLSDERLMAQVAQGDRSALEILYDRHAARVLGFSLQVLGERAAAEELLQEAFWQVWRSAATFRPQTRTFASWLFMIVRKLASAGNHQRNNGIQEIIKTIPEHSTLDSATQLRNALSNLPHAQRQVIEMAYFQGMTRQEIANSTGETLDTISSLARLGLRKLQEALEPKAN